MTPTLEAPSFKTDQPTAEIAHGTLSGLGELFSDSFLDAIAPYINKGTTENFSALELLNIIRETNDMALINIMEGYLDSKYSEHSTKNLVTVESIINTPEYRNFIAARADSAENQDFYVTKNAAELRIGEIIEKNNWRILAH
jgi:hypothetical protein